MTWTNYSSRYEEEKHRWSIMWLAESMILKPLNQFYNSKRCFSHLY